MMHGRADVAGIACEHVAYRYGRTEVLHDVSFDVRTGVIGLLGVNGAGKTTLMRLVAGLLRPSSGSVTVAGCDMATEHGREQSRPHIGYMPQEFEIMRFATVFDNVAYAAWAHGVPVEQVDAAASSALHDVDLLDMARRRAYALSGGQRRRLALACALAHRPSVMLLDEPTAGVDPVQRARMRTMIASFGESNTVFMSTHLVDDVLRVADHLLMLADGVLVFDGPVESIPGEPQMRAHTLERMMAGDR